MQSSPQHHRPSLRFSRVFVSILALWMTFAVLDSTGDVLLFKFSAFQVFSRKLAVAGIGAIFSLVMYVILRALPRWSLRARLGIVALFAAPAGIALGIGYFLVLFVWWPLAPAEREIASIGLHRLASLTVFENIIAWYFMFAAWGAVYLAMSYAAEVGDAEQRSSQLREQA